LRHIDLRGNETIKMGPAVRCVHHHLLACFSVGVLSCTWLVFDSSLGSHAWRAFVLWVRECLACVLKRGESGASVADLCCLF
jgi:hypothetical protein